jgi:hypothetical protein
MFLSCCCYGDSNKKDEKLIWIKLLLSVDLLKIIKIFSEFNIELVRCRLLEIIFVKSTWNRYTSSSKLSS